MAANEEERDQCHQRDEREGSEVRVQRAQDDRSPRHTVLQGAASTCAGIETYGVEYGVTLPPLFALRCICTKYEYQGPKKMVVCNRHSASSSVRSSRRCSWSVGSW